MKRRLILAFVLFQSLLFAQVQDLPDLEITGESQVKIFLYKKALPYQKDSSMADSLADFFPSSRPELQGVMQAETKLLPRHYLALNLYSMPAFDGVYRFYPDLDILSVLGIYYQQERAAKGYSYMEAGLQMGLDLSKAGHLHSRGLYLHTKTKQSATLKHALGQFALATPDLDFDSFNLNKMRNQLRLYTLKQEDWQQVRRENTLSWQHYSELEISSLRLQEFLVINGEKPGFSFTADTPFLPFTSSRFGVIYDGRHLLPAFSFYQDFKLGADRSISISNSAECLPDAYFERLHEYKYISFPAALRHQGVPLNLAVQYEAKNPQVRDYKLAGWKLKNSSRYVFNDKGLRYDELTGNVQMQYHNTLENRSAMELDFSLQDFRFTWELALVLAHLENENWRRKPYQPLLEANGELSYERGKYQLGLSLLQGYFRRDEAQKHLPESIDLALKGSRTFNQNARLILEASNLLDMPVYQHRALPKAGVNLNLGLQMLF